MCAQSVRTVLGEIGCGPQNAFNVGGVWWLEGQTLNSSTNMFLDLMEMAAGRRLSDTIVVSCV